MMEQSVVYPSWPIYQKSKEQLALLESHIREGSVSQSQALVEAFLMGMQVAQRVYSPDPLNQDA